MKPPYDLTGKKFGKLTAISISHKRHLGAYWYCLCDCGVTTTALAAKLRNGRTQSCGCRVGTTVFTHKKTGTTEYNIWTNIKTRCYNPKSEAYHRYGGRGIKMCDRWFNSFEDFLSDVGNRPSLKHTLDRRNNDGNYEPGNIKWSTIKEQNNNTSVNFLVNINGESKPIQLVAESANLKASTLRKRLTSGWSVDEAIHKPVANRKKN